MISSYRRTRVRVTSYLSQSSHRKNIFEINDQPSPVRNRSTCHNRVTGKIFLSPTHEFLPQVPELNITERFGEDVGDLLRGVDVLYRDRPILHERAEMMVLYRDVFCSRPNFGCLNEVDTALIVLVDCAVYDWCVFAKWYDTSQFTKETNERYDVSQRGGKSHVLAFRCRQGDLRLKFGCPNDGAVCEGNDVSGAGEH